MGQIFSINFKIFKQIKTHHHHHHHYQCLSKEDASATTDSPLETSMGTRMELVKGRTTLVERGATQLGGETLVVEICKLLKGFPATHGLIGPVDITDNLLGSGNQ